MPGSNIPDDLGPFVYGEADQLRFRSGELCLEWFVKYPQLFDASDLARAQNQGGLSAKTGARLHQHFVEWQAAITIYERFGLLSLYEKYLDASHPHKQAILLDVVGSELYEQLIHPSVIFGGTQPPDLFVYSQDRSGWCFCEVKGPRDTVSLAQRFYFDHLGRLTGKPVRYALFSQPERVR